MIGNDIYSSLASTINPCVGCTSLSCAMCDCYSGCNSERDELRMLRVPASYKSEKPKDKVQSKNLSSDNKRSNRTVHLSSAVFGNHNKAEIYIADSNGMSGAGIHEGDYIIFDTELAPLDGDVVIAVIEGIKYCRRYFLEGEKARFRREDGITPDVVTTDFSVIGVMVGLMRKIERVS